MLLFSHDKQPARDSTTDDKSTAAYRRTSIPAITAFDVPQPQNTPAPAPPARRAPLASLDPQVAATLPLDYLMSSLSSQVANSLAGDAHAESSKDAERSQDSARFAIGRPIAINRAVDDEALLAIHNIRRRSLSNHPHSSTVNNGRSLPYSQNRLAPRRPNTTTSAISPASRRPSVPGCSSQNLAVPGQQFGVGLNEDLYSGLSSFTFGAVHSPSTPQASDTTELISPLTRVTDSADHTPRPSISGPSGTKPPSKSRNGKQKAVADADMGDDEYEDEDDNVRQKSRSKMRAIDDGSRRPSLPVNAYIPEGSSSPPPVSSSDPQRQMSPGSTSEQDTSEADAEEQGDLDTDVEFDYQHHSDVDEVVLPDDASQHTFGGGFDHYGFRGGNLLTSDQMSINEDDEEDSDTRDVSVSPVTFTQPGDDNEDLDVGQNIRRGMSYNLPEATASLEDSTTLSRDREDSMATVKVGRASRSMDDDLNVLPSSASTMRQNDSQRMDEVLDFDAHIPLSVDPEPQGEPAGDVYDGFRLDYILDDGAHRHSVSQASFIDPNRSETFATASQDISPFSWMPGVGGGRRPSTVTVGTTAGEDIFTRHVRKNDEKYGQRRFDWSFRKESSDGRGPRIMLAPTSEGVVSTGKSMASRVPEIWRQAYIGRFKVERDIVSKPPKADQHRVNCRHIPDPYSKGNNRGGPGSVIHKHSRAVAFSIFRNNKLFKPHHGKHITHMNTSTSILLATKKVQEQYTSTRTTAKLNSHGLLDDRALGVAASGTVFSPTSTAAAPSIRTPSRVSATGVRKERSHSRAMTQTPTDDNKSIASSVGASAQTTSGWTEHSSVSSTTSPSRSPAPPSVPSSPAHTQPPTHVPAMSMSSSATTETAKPSERATSMDSIKGSFSLSTAASETMHSQSNSSRSDIAPDTTDDIMDLDEEQSPPRTSHAEAFATVDSNYLEFVRGREQRPHYPHPDHDSHGLFGGIRRRFLGPAKARGSPGSAGTSTSALEANYHPPWLTMASRSKVEERERVIQNLNESFKDVGLLPSFRTPRSNHDKVKRAKTASSTNIFANVPVDCLYMLLPLWPGETDKPAIEHREDPNSYIIPVEERQYLLVYYVPFDERLKKKRDKKRTREDVTRPASGISGPNITLQSFRICARLVSYSDLRETGVRLPAYGMSITGSMIEATRYLPPPSIRDLSLDDIVIGVCHTRESGMEMLPEGLVRLGLCMPTDEPTPVPLREEEEPEDLDVKLTPIGRAAVEMAWLGSMAVTCFGTA